MRLLTLLLFSLAATACKGDNKKPSFLNDTMIGKNITELKPQYFEALKEENCSKEDKQICDAIHGDCKCHRLDMARLANFNHALFFTTSNNKVVRVFETWGTPESFFHKYLKPISNYIGTVPPQKISEVDSTGRPFQYYNLFWSYEEGDLMALVACPLNYHGEIRNCLLSNYFLLHGKPYSKQILDVAKDKVAVEKVY